MCFMHICRWNSGPCQEIYIKCFICSLCGRNLFSKGHRHMFLYYLCFQMPEELFPFPVIREKSFTQVKMQQQPDQSTDKRAVLAGHVIKRWRLVFLTQERIICDLNKERKAWLWVQWSGDAGVAAVQLWSDCEEIAHIQGQRRSPQKTVEGAKSCLESNPIPTRDAQRAQTYLVCTRTKRPHRDWDRSVFECLMTSTGQQRTVAVAGALGAADLGVAQALLEEVVISPILELPELT